MSTGEPTQEEAAYLVWAGEGEQSDVKTAEVTGIPRSTIGYWRRRDDWRARWLTAAGPEAELAAAGARTLARAGMHLVTKRLLAIVGGQVPARTTQGEAITGPDGRPVMVWEADHRDAVNAAKLLALYGWGQPSMQDTAGYGAIPDASYTVVPQGGEESIEDIRAQASAMIEATVASVNTRTKHKGRRT